MSTIQRWMAGAAVALAVALFVGGAVNAAPPGSQFNLFLLLNGTPSKIGTLSISDAGVATTLDSGISISDGQVIYGECNAEACIGPGGFASCTFTSTDYKPKMDVAPADRRYWVMSGQSVISMKPTGDSADCALFKMQ